MLFLDTFDMTNTEPILKLNKVNFSYQDTLVIQDISLIINKGEFVGIIGPNGGGKTTLLKLIMGFLRPTNGEISIYNDSHHDGVNTPNPVAMTNHQARNRIAYVPQSLQFDKQFPISVLELVLGGRLSHLPWYGVFKKIDKHIALEALEQVGLSNYTNASFGKLSGGQAQRALIARALASQPQLLMLDEPTASVDVQAETDIYNILKSLQGKMTIMMVTHNLQTAIELVDRVICVQKTSTEFSPQQICEHFALGLYHAPLIKVGKANTTYSNSNQL